MKNKDEKQQNYKAVWIVIRKTLKNQKLLSVLLILIIIGAITSALFPPLILGKIIDGLTNRQEVVRSMAALYFGILILSGLFNSLKEILITVFGQKITHELRSEMCRKLRNLPASYFTKNEPGNITSRFVNDVDAVEMLFANGIISMGVDICKIAGILLIIMVKSTGLGILLLLAVPFIYAFTRSVQKRMLAAQKENRTAIGRVNQWIPETINNIRTIHCLVKESYMEEQYDKKIQESYHAVDKANFYDSVYSPVINMFSTVIIAILMLLSAKDGQLQSLFGVSVGTAVALIAYVEKVFGPMESIGMEIQNIQSAVAGMNRINEFLTENEEKTRDETITYTTLMKGREKGIQLRQIEFSYADGQKVIDGLNLSITSGETVTLAGRTGSGKSTIFKLLLGLYSPQQGNVLIFGKEACLIPHKEKRKLFGYVEQSFHLVPGTIEDQISLFDDKISREDVIQAAKLVGIHENIMLLPDGYETDCRKTAFSQGQLQLLSIARAVVSNPPIMLLDEITANLDSLTEQTVLQALERAAKGRTVISISHHMYHNLGTRLITI